MSKITILGAGRVGTTLAAGFAKAGHAVTIGARRSDAVRANWQGPDVAFAGLEEAAVQAEIVVNALPGDQSVSVVTALKPALDGKILLDVANATQRDERGMPVGLLYRDTSLGQKLQDALPQTRVVKTLNTMAFPVMTNPAVLKDAPKVFISGDDAEARERTAVLLAELGWRADAIIDLGAISSAAAMEALFLLVPHFVQARGFVPFALTIAV